MTGAELHLLIWVGLAAAVLLGAVPLVLIIVLTWKFGPSWFLPDLPRRSPRSFPGPPP